jgi:uncharacterized delta-60 repeat protein
MKRLLRLSTPTLLGVLFVKALLFTGTSASAATVYTNRASFLAASGAGPTDLNQFSDLTVPQQLPALTYQSGSKLRYTISTSPGYDVWGLVGAVSVLDLNGDPCLRISIPDGATAIGANFYLTDSVGIDSPGTLLAVLSDGTSLTFSAGSTNAFIGVVAGGPKITVLDIHNPNFMVDQLYPTMDNLYVVGAASLPPYTYTTNNGTITITGYTGTGGVVSIPSMISGLPVTSIGDNAFVGRANMTGITTPSSVTNIGYQAFGYCSGLTSVSVGSGVAAIGHWAFNQCVNLTNVTIPASVSSIREATFAYCNRLGSITVDALSPHFSSVDGVLFDRNQTKLVQYPGGKAGSYAIPSGVTNIQVYSFYGCRNVTSVTIPASVSVIGETPFGYCTSLGAVVVDALNPAYGSTDGVLFNKRNSKLAQFPAGRGGSYHIPNGVAGIENLAFCGASSLSNVTLSGSITTLGWGAFEGCTGLSSITMGCGVTYIADNAFCGNPSLRGIYFQGNSPAIGVNIFLATDQVTVFYLSGTTGWGATFGGRPTAVWITPPIIAIQPTDQTVLAGENASLSAVAVGTPPLNYQWQFNGANLANGGRVSGANTNALLLTGVLTNDAGSYSLVVTNTCGSVTSQVVSVTVTSSAPVIIIQPQSRVAALGQSVTLDVLARGTEPLSYQWQKDGTNLSGAVAATLTLPNFQASDVGVYQVVVSNAFGSETSAVAVLTVNLATLDIGFNPRAGDRAYAFAEQPGGGLLTAGRFTSLGGQPRSYLARLTADGALDPGFNPGASSWPYTLAIQPDGKILVGGWFTNLAGQVCNHLGRLNADGTLDASFKPGADSAVYALVVQLDGKILVGGAFTNLAGQARNYLARLNGDGTLDASFNPGANDHVYCLTLQPDGKILVGGAFTNLAGQARNYLGRLNGDGTLDASFNPGADYDVYSLVVQANGKTLVGGWFGKLGGQTRLGIGRLNGDGTLDESFNPAAVGEVYSLALQADEKILLGGFFTSLGGQSRSFAGRLHADGTLDLGFNPLVNDGVVALGLQADGKVLLSGYFTNLCGQSREHIGRLNSPESATQSLTYDGSKITWLRGGSSPEVWRTSFEYSANTGNWVALGAGSRITNGWQLTAESLPPGATLRARGYTTSGYANATSYYVESTLIVDQPPPPPTILVNDGSFGVVSNQFGFHFVGTAGDVVVVEGSTNLFDWLPLQTNTLGGTPDYFSDPSWLSLPQRFYRVRRW